MDDVQQSLFYDHGSVVGAWDIPIFGAGPKCTLFNLKLLPKHKKLASNLDSHISLSIYFRKWRSAFLRKKKFVRNLIPLCPSNNKLLMSLFTPPLASSIEFAGPSTRTPRDSKTFRRSTTSTFLFASSNTFEDVSEYNQFKVKARCFRRWKKYEIGIDVNL